MYAHLRVILVQRDALQDGLLKCNCLHLTADDKSNG